MNRGNVQFLLLRVSIVIALSVYVNGSKMKVRPSLMVGEDESKLDNFLYVVNNTRDQPCILANVSINFAIPYEKENKTFNVPNDAAVQGHCSPVASEMALSWKEGKTDKNNTIKFTFVNDHTNFTVFSIELNVYKDKDKFPNDGDKWFVARSDLDLHLFPAFLENGIHKCEKKEVKLNGTELILANVSLIAFNNKNDISSRKEVTKCVDPEKDGINSKTFPYIAKWKNNTICGLLRASFTVQMSYTLTDSKTKGKNITVPTTANAVESCTTDTFEIEIVWGEEQHKNSILLHFSKMGKNLLRYVIINVFMDKENFPDAINAGKNALATKSTNLFPTPVNGIYSCTEEIEITTGYDINVTISDILLIPFDPVENNLATKKVADCKSNISEYDFHYVVRNDEKIPCILANMNISIDTNNSQNKDVIIVPSEANATGICDTKRSEMKLAWTKSGEKEENNIIFYITRNKTDIFIYQIEVTIFADKIHKMSDFGLALFSTPGIYNCTDQNWQIKLDDVTININNVLFTAFNTDENLDSRTVTDCSRNQDSTTSSSATTETKSTTTDQSSTTPVPDPYANEYNYVVINEKTHVACIAANMTISMKVPYVTKESKTSEAILTIPADSAVNGNCGAKNSMMELTWLEKSKGSNSYKDEKNNSFKINFQKGESNYLLHSIELNIYMDETNFPNSNDERYTAVENIDIISTPLNNLYKCGDNTSVKVKDVDVTIANVTLIAFNTEKKIATKSVMCIQDTSSNVGLIIGCIIGGIMILGISALLMYLYFSECFSCSIFSNSR